MEKMEEEFQKPETLIEYTEFVCSRASTHGGQWYSPLSKYPCIKSTYFIALSIAHLSMISIFFFTLWTNYGADIMQTSTDFIYETDVNYPKITICSPKPFSRSKTHELNVSPSLLSYMFLGQRPLNFNPEAMTPQIIFKLEQQFQNLRGNSSIEKLYSKISLSCEELFIKCHKSSSLMKCCGEIFNPSPFLTSSGVCFTAPSIKMIGLEAHMGHINIEINASRHLTADLNDSLLFPLDGDNAILALGYEDHGLAALATNSRELQRGVSTKIKMELEEMDRTQLEEEEYILKLFKKNPKCIGPKLERYQKLIDYGFDKWTSNNCYLYWNQFLYPKCDYLWSYGLNRSKTNITLDKCTPNDIAKEFDSFIKNLGNYSKNISEDCLSGCFQSKVILDVSTFPIEAKDQSDIDVKDLIELKLQFISNTKTTHTISAKPFSDTVANIGGWLGFIMGASIVSLLEMIYFLWILVGVFINFIKEHFILSFSNKIRNVNKLQIQNLK